MRLKTFTAPSMAEAMNLVKTHLGADAIIVSTQKGDGGLGVRITAAIEAVEDEDHYDQYVEDADPSTSTSSSSPCRPPAGDR